MAADRALRCAVGHSFDVARQGYVSLLPAGAQTGTGDSAEMVAAREEFLAAGHFAPLAEVLAEEAAASDLPEGCVVELGAGTGYYLAAVLERLPGRRGLALDNSRYALRRAARAHPRIGAVGCDAWRELPVRDAVAALGLVVFSPRNGPELARVLAPGGALVVVTPGDRHLHQLVEPLGLLRVDEEKEARLAAELNPFFELVRRRDWEEALDLGAGEVERLVAMGPSARHVESLGAARACEVTASVTVSVYRRGNASGVSIGTALTS